MCCVFGLWITYRSGHCELLRYIMEQWKIAVETKGLKFRSCDNSPGERIYDWCVLCLFYPSSFFNSLTGCIFQRLTTDVLLA